MADPSVLIVGAGPTGLVLALWLTKQGVPVRIIDETAEPGTTSRALAVHARTLELYEQLDLAGLSSREATRSPAFAYGSAAVKRRGFRSSKSPRISRHMAFCTSSRRTNMSGS